MTEIERLLRRTNRSMIAFDLALGSGAIFAPDATLRLLLGHDTPTDDARELFRRNGPLWLTFAAAPHGRGDPWRAARLVGARVAARQRDRDRRAVGPLARLHPAGRPRRALVRGREQSRHGARLRRTRPTTPLRHCC